MKVLKERSPLASYAATRDLNKDLEDIDGLLGNEWSIDDGWPLATAAQRCDLDLMEVLIYSGANVYLAMRKVRNAEVVREIARAFNHIRTGIIENDDYVQVAKPCALTRAALGGNLEQAKIFIAAGENVSEAMRQCGEAGEAAINLLYVAVWEVADEVCRGVVRKASQ